MLTCTQVETQVINLEVGLATKLGFRGAVVMTTATQVSVQHYKNQRRALETSIMTSTELRTIHLMRHEEQARVSMEYCAVGPSHSLVTTPSAERRSLDKWEEEDVELKRDGTKEHKRRTRGFNGQVLSGRLRLLSG